jgi:hypothetical protein
MYGSSLRVVIKLAYLSVWRLVLKDANSDAALLKSWRLVINIGDSYGDKGCSCTLLCSQILRDDPETRTPPSAP